MKSNSYTLRPFIRKVVERGIILFGLFVLSTSVSAQIISSFEMISNGNGPITELIGFDVTNPTVDDAYSADWYRDVLESTNIPPTIQLLPGGMQAAGGWYFIVARPSMTDNESAQNRWTRGGALNFVLEGNTYEIRFTVAGGKAIYWSTDAVVDVPFEIWFLGMTPDDDSDDVRMIPRLWDNEYPEGPFSFTLDHPIDDGDNDPYSDRIYFFMPEDDSPGHAGYDEFVETESMGDAEEHLARVVLMNWDQHQSGSDPVNAMPEVGTTFRITATDFPPTCTIISAGAEPPHKLEIEFTDGTGIASVSIISSNNAAVTIPDFDLGDNFAYATITQIDPEVSFWAELEIEDIGENSTSCGRGFDPQWFAIHNVGNIILAIQPNSHLGTFRTPLEDARDLNAFWPRDVGPDHLFAGNLWVGTIIDSQKLVVDNTFGPGDWSQTPGSGIDISKDISDQDISVTYDDRFAPPTPIGLRVNQESFQWSHPTRDDFIIFNYVIENTGPEVLTEVYAALWFDLDIDDNDPSTLGNAGTDLPGYDSDRGLIYLYDDFGLGGYIGIKVIGDSPFSATAYRNGFGEDPGNDSDRYYYMTIGFPPLLTEASDVRIIITAPPFDLDDEHSVLFGLVMGEDLADLQANSDMMEMIYHFESAEYAIGNWVEDGMLRSGQGNALITKLQAALARLEKGNKKATSKQLSAFVNQVNAFIHGGALSEEYGEYLIDHATAIIEILDGGAGKRGIESDIVEVPGQVNLEQNYPNPFNPTTQIRFELPETARVRLVIYDVLGRELVRLVDGVRQAGAYEVQFDATKLPSGVYFYRLDTPKQTLMRTMLLVK